jgi:MoaA/NifB/PqqE/SkfB family radical SAM enzyme
MYREDGTAKIQKKWKLWEKGLNNLKALGNEFCAVYGAEPLQDFDYLPEFFEYTKKLEMYHTLITNCVGADVKEKLKELVKAGLNSLTVSFDGSDDELNDKSSTLKSGKGLETVRWFKKEFKDKVRDTAVVFTLTKTNLFKILDWIPKFSEEGVFVFFDLIHHDIGNPGTKCKNYNGIEELIFKEGDEKLLQKFAIELRDMKETGRYTIHQSNTFINILTTSPEIYINRLWNCADSDVFPSWVTIDNDGTTRICDDFYIKGEKDWKFWDLTPEIFKGEFREYWREKTLKHCCQCMWNTHIDANAIKSGEEKFEDYVNNCLKK